MDLTTLLILLVKASIVTLMVSLGVGLEWDALREFRHRPWLIVRAVLGTCVLVPLAALLLLKLPISFQMSVGARFGIALMALSPSAPLTLRKAHLKGGDRHLAALLQVAAALSAIISIPVLTDVFRSAYQVEGWDISPKTVALQVALVQVLPLTAGLLLRQWFPKLATRWAVPLQKAALLVTLAVMGLVLFKVLPRLLSFLAGNLVGLAAMVVMTAVALAIGTAMAGPNPEERTTTALVTSMRNPGLALLLAITHGNEVAGVKMAIVLYLLVTILATIPFLSWTKQLRRS